MGDTQKRGVTRPLRSSLRPFSKSKRQVMGWGTTGSNLKPCTAQREVLEGPLWKLSHSWAKQIRQKCLLIWNVAWALVGAVL